MAALTVRELWKRLLLIKGINMEIVLGVCVVLIFISMGFIIWLREQNKEERASATHFNEVFESKAKISEDYTAMVNKYYSDIKDIKLLHDEALNKLQTTYDRELSARKSSEVRVGQISEQILPFLSAWPFDPKNFRFSGDPIDGISYENDRVVFVEIKTGKSRLSKRQENIKKLVKEGKVEFITIRVNEEGILVK